MNNAEQQWDAMTNEQKVAWIATDIMEWHKHEDYPEWWTDENKYTGFAVPDHGQPTMRTTFEPFTDWNHWRSVEMKVMHGDYLLYAAWMSDMTLAQESYKGFWEYMDSDLPTRAKALYLAFHSLPH